MHYPTLTVVGEVGANDFNFWFDSGEQVLGRMQNAVKFLPIVLPSSPSFRTTALGCEMKNRTIGVLAKSDT